MCVFLRTSGRVGENVATEILVYILTREDRFMQFQGRFFRKIFGEPYKVSNKKAEMFTQISFEKDKPDIVAYMNNSLLIFEIKLGSFLSSDNQLVRYTKIFNETEKLRSIFPSMNDNEIKNRYFIYIAPDKIIYPSLTATMSTIKSNEKSFKTYCSKQGIIFNTISWEEINKLLDTVNELEKELGLYIKNFINQELTKKEISVLTENSVPSSLLKLTNLINTTKYQIDFQNFGNIKSSNSYNYLGFYFGNDDLEFYFGYILPVWEIFGTPIFLQARKTRIHQNADRIVNKLIELGFKRNKDDHDEFVIPFDLEEVSEWKKKIEEIMNKISK